MIEDYLLWMISEGYADPTITRYEQILNYFKRFITYVEKKRSCPSFRGFLYSKNLHLLFTVQDTNILDEFCIV